jgi:tRNA modification GTPase
MQAGLSDTVFALASGQGRAAVAVIRVSGPECREIVSALCGRLPAPRRASVRRLRGAHGTVLDEAVVLWFPGPGSYTGEDSAELQVHGGLAVVEAVLLALGTMGARPAGPGEFTRRAVLNGRMDLLAAEAVADLIDAETSAQRDQALKQMHGALGDVYTGWSARLLRLLAQQEALIDFPDEDLPAEVTAAMAADIDQIGREMAVHLDDDGRGERLRTGLVFAISGAPNVGKSTLINALCRREVAIVSPLAGTTRDVLEARVVLGGIPVTLLDTAGLRDTEDPVEAEGVRRARARVAAADLVIALTCDGDAAPDAMAASDGRILSVLTKSDLFERIPDGILAVSAKSGLGMAALITRLESIAQRLAGPREAPALSRARHRLALHEAMMCLDAARNAVMPELCGEELRQAVQSLGRITGRVSVEDVLDSVFSQFCIGK